MDNLNENSNLQENISEDTISMNSTEINENTNFVESNEEVNLNKSSLTKDLFEFIGPKNFDYYYRVFKKHSNSDSFASWNWCSFLFTPYWLLYRKLYLWFAAFIGAEIIIDIVWSVSTLFGALLKIALIVVFGIFGNCMYLHHCKSRVKKINTTSEEFDCNEEVLKANGGVNKLAPFVLFLITLALFLALTIIAIGAISLANSSFGAPFHGLLGTGML